MLRGTLDLGLSALPFVYGAFTLSRLPFQVIQLGLTSILPVLNPEKPELLGLGSALFARRYCGHLVLFLFLRVLRCFSSPGSLPYVMDWRMDT